MLSADGLLETVQSFVDRMFLEFKKSKVFLQVFILIVIYLSLQVCSCSILQLNFEADIF